MNRYMSEKAVSDDLEALNLKNFPHTPKGMTNIFSLATPLGGYDLILHNMNSEKNNFTECAMDIRILFQNNVLV